MKGYQMNIEFVNYIKQIAPSSLKKYLNPFAFIIYTFFWIGGFEFHTDIFGQTDPPDVFIWHWTDLLLTFLYFETNKILQDYYYRVEPREEDKIFFKIMKIYLRLTAYIWLFVLFYQLLTIEELIL